MNYIELQIVIKEDITILRDIIISDLSDIGFESFEETETGAKAYIKEEEFNEKAFKELPSILKNQDILTWSHNKIKQINWNEEWEKNFNPIIVGDKCLVRATFHKIEEKYDYEVIITPKMSFGTGHHATTSLMIEYLLDMQFEGKSVLDMGCGTSILAILCAKKNAINITAIDTDEWAVENSKENIHTNAISNIRLIQGDREVIPDESYDVILANINLNVLKEDIPHYVNHLREKGALLFSGFYEGDITEISKIAVKQGLRLTETKVKDKWAALKFELKK